MKAISILKHFLSVANWVDPRDTVDRIIIGNPDKRIKSILVTWISSFEALQAAVKGGFDMVITHEPTFWENADELQVTYNNGIGMVKRKFIEANDLVILRCHDVWDRMPLVGIPWAWARFLGFGDKPCTTGMKGFLHRYDIDPIRLDDLAGRVAAKTYEIGEPIIQVCGDSTQVISRVGIGTGCFCNPSDFQEMGCNVSIVCDDGTGYWREIQRAMDEKHPIIRVNHGTSEEPGMATLTEYINKIFPGVCCVHHPHRASYRLVGNYERFQS